MGLGSTNSNLRSTNICLPLRSLHWSTGPHGFRRLFNVSSPWSIVSGFPWVTWDHQLWKRMEWHGCATTFWAVVVCKAVPPMLFAVIHTLDLLELYIFLKLIRRFSKIGQPTMVPETLLWVVCLNRFTMFSLKAMFGCLGTGTVIFSFLSVLFTRDSTVGCNLRCCCYCCCFDINNTDMIAVSVGNCISIVLIFEVWSVDIWVAEDIKMLTPRNCAVGCGVSTKVQSKSEVTLVTLYVFTFVSCVY